MKILELKLTTTTKINKNKINTFTKKYTKYVNI